MMELNGIYPEIPDSLIPHERRDPNTMEHTTIYPVFDERTTYQIEDYLELIGKTASKYKSKQIDLLDAISVATLAFYRATQTYEGRNGAQFETYAIACMRNAIIDLIRKQPDNEVPLDDAVVNKVAAKEDRKSYLRLLLTDRIEELPERERDIIKMNFGIDCDELTMREIAVKLGISYQRVFQLKDRAILRLKLRMTSEA